MAARVSNDRTRSGAPRTAAERAHARTPRELGQRTRMHLAPSQSSRHDVADLLDSDASRSWAKVVLTWVSGRVLPRKIRSGCLQRGGEHNWFVAHTKPSGHSAVALGPEHTQVEAGTQGPQHAFTTTATSPAGHVGSDARQPTVRRSQFGVTGGVLASTAPLSLLLSGAPFSSSVSPPQAGGMDSKKAAMYAGVRDGLMRILVGASAQGAKGMPGIRRA